MTNIRRFTQTVELETILIKMKNDQRKKLNHGVFLVSTITEAAFSRSSNFREVMIVNADEDSALRNLSYYEQNNNGGTQCVSCFCNPSDGIEPGSNRVTDVEISKNDCNRPSKLSIYVGSTGKKLGIPLMKRNEEGTNDGICERV